MAQGRPYSSTEAEEARRMSATAEQLLHHHGGDIPRDLRSAVAHVLYAVAVELNNGRPVPIEIRRDARHVVQARRAGPPPAEHRE